ncbi:hypothetical protein R9X47_25015 [Wukongibacter baidiensis]|uniref:hypothetical protein n=1 Tax=Wukongibacter baidiensis TaxID=1723361 RepID=UPI003D7F409F
MDKKYVIVGENNSVSSSMSRKEAINKAKEYSNEGKTAYIVSEEEGKRIKEEGRFNTPEWKE